jgi:hypothetical protein
MIITLATSQNLQNKKHWIRLNTSQWPNGKATQLDPLLLGLLHLIQLLEAFTLRELVVSHYVNWFLWQKCFQCLN